MEALAGHYPALDFVLLQEVFAPNGQHFISEGAQERRTPAPDDLVAWLRNHPNLETSEPEPVTIWGREGVRLDMSVSPAPQNHSYQCGTDPCLFLFGTQENGLFLLDGDRTRMIVMDDIEGETVVIAVSARADAFDSFLPKAQLVLDTVEWEAES